MDAVSVFIPVYNEERVISRNLQLIHEKLTSLNYDFELIIVDDGSTDSTPSIVRRMQGRLSHVKYYRNQRNAGRGEVISAFIHKARHEKIIFFDIDMATDLEFIPTLVRGLERYDLVTGSRWLPESKVHRKFSRWVISYAYNIFIRIMFKSSIRDHQCGFKGFKKGNIIEILEDMGIRKNRSWAWDTELLIKAQARGLSIWEFPVVWNEGKVSHFNVVHAFRTVFIHLLRYGFGLI